MTAKKAAPAANRAARRAAPKKVAVEHIQRPKTALKTVEQRLASLEADFKELAWYEAELRHIIFLSVAKEAAKRAAAASEQEIMARITGQRR